MKRFVFILALVFIYILTQSAWAAEYYVSKSGSDSNPGTEAQPWKTIQKAAKTLVAGDTVYIKAGTYKERVIPKNSGSSGKYITYTAYQGDTVSIDGSGITLPAYWGGLLDISNKSYIKISGLRIMNAGPDDNNPGILVDNCSDITIENNYTYNTTSSGIGVWDSSNIIIDNNEVEKACNDGEQECITVAITNNFEIRNNHVHHSGPGTMGGEGIDAKDGSRNGKIYNNYLHHLNRLGIYVDAWDKNTENIEVFQNIVHDIYNNDGFTLASESGGLLENISIYNNIAYNCDICGLTISRNGESPIHPMKNIKIINNTFYNNGAGGWGGGIAVDNPNIQNVVIRNNIVSQNITFQMEVEPDVSKSNLIVDHNLIHGYRSYDDEIKGTDYVEGNPLFVNASSADFHLQENSPAIDNGSSINAPSDDYDGNTRPQGSGYDIGAYEYQSGGSTEAEISLNPTEINITTIAGTTGAITETFTISNIGSGTLDWSVVDNATWLSVNPASGSDSGQVIVTVYPTRLSAGSYTGIVTVSSPDAINSPQTVTVHLTVKSSSEDQAPFGQFETPVHGSTVRSSVPFTGWALDDVSVESVKIYRGPVAGGGGNWVYIGDALLVEGARPDIETAFPGYPNNSRAGWGYMMLTHFLPNSGNGTFTFYAVVKDSGGHEVTLGSKTITCDNVNAVKPFGAIDTPTQGGIASGSSFRNHGWALTPMPNRIPTDGSTIHVYVDGVDLGHPVYNVYRSDIAELFPGYANSHGAHAYFDFDTTAYTNGVHTIHWTAQDNAGNADGIGSRYFTIKNYAKRKAPSAELPWQGINKEYRSVASGQCPESSKKPVGVIKGYKRNIRPLMSYPDKNGNITIEITELERLELYIDNNNKDQVEVKAEGDRSDNSKFKIQNSKFYSGYMVVGDQIRALPIGSTFDTKKGIFYWHPGPGFIGKYRLVFIIRRDIGTFTKRNITIKIVPQFPNLK